MGGGVGGGKCYLEHTAALEFDLLKNVKPSTVYYFVNGFNPWKVNPTKQHEKMSGLSCTKKYKICTK